MCVSSRLINRGRHSSVVSCQRFSASLKVLKSQNNNHVCSCFLPLSVPFSDIHTHSSPCADNSEVLHGEENPKALPAHLLKLKYNHMSVNGNVSLSLPAKSQHPLLPNASNAGINPQKMSEAIIK